MSSSYLEAEIIEKKLDRPPIQFAYPQVTGLKSQEIQDLINWTIRRQVRHLIIQQGGKRKDLEEMIGNYQVTLNEKGLLSIKFENFSFIQLAAHGTTVVRGLTLNLNSGKVYDIFNFFRPSSGYNVFIKDQVEKQIMERDIQLISELNVIGDDQEYYLTDNELVVFFQEATVAPRVFGVLEFPIPFKLLTNFIDPDQPLARFIK